MTDELTTPQNPVRGTPESATWFRVTLEQLGETQASMARLMKRKGDDRKPETIARHMRRMATGEARVSGEMRMILTMMLRAKELRRTKDGGEGNKARGSIGGRSAPVREHRPAVRPDQVRYQL